jgi:hypothetical protein
MMASAVECPALAMCCAGVGDSGDREDCEETADEGDEADCSAAQAMFCTDGGTASGDPCGDLTECCDELSGDDEDTCEDVVDEEDDAMCTTALATYCP